MNVISAVNTNLSNVEKGTISNAKGCNDISNLNITNNYQDIMDSTDFSMDYSKDTVASVLSGIKTAFEDSLKDVYQNVSITDNGQLYGDILNRINSSSDFDDNEKLQLTKALDNTFDNYVKSISGKIADNTSDFLNRACNIEKSYAENGTDLGIRGQSIINKAEFGKNVENMLSAVKIFYKNNSGGTKEDLQKFLEKNFSTTESIEKLSYNDFTALSKAIDVSLGRSGKDGVPDVNIISSFEKQNEAMNAAANGLKAGGASKIVTDAFGKAIAQNCNSNNRIMAYSKIRYQYEKKLEQIRAQISEEQAKLKELKKKQKEMMEEYRREMKKIQDDRRKLMSAASKDKQKELLTKQYSSNMDMFRKENDQIEGNIKELNNFVKEEAKQFEAFLKEPASVISDYLSKGQDSVIA